VITMKQIRYYLSIEDMTTPEKVLISFLAISWVGLLAFYLYVG